MNHYELDYMVNEQKRKLNKINREAWKHSRGYSYKSSFLNKFFLSVIKR